MERRKAATYLYRAVFLATFVALAAGAADSIFFLRHYRKFHYFSANLCQESLENLSRPVDRAAALSFSKLVNSFEGKQNIVGATLGIVAGDERTQSLLSNGPDEEKFSSFLGKDGACEIRVGDREHQDCTIMRNRMPQDHPGRKCAAFKGDSLSINCLVSYSIDPFLAPHKEIHESRCVYITSNHRGLTNSG